MQLRIWGSIREFILYGISIRPLIFFYILEVLPERGFSFVKALYWLSLVIICVPLSIKEINTENSVELHETYYPGIFLITTELVRVSNRVAKARGKIKDEIYKLVEIEYVEEEILANRLDSQNES